MKKISIKTESVAAIKLDMLIQEKIARKTEQFIKDLLEQKRAVVAYSQKQNLVEYNKSHKEKRLTGITSA